MRSLLIIGTSRLAGELLNTLDYQRRCDKSALISSFSDSQIFEFDRINKGRKAVP